jgi:hypothetical protein
MMKTRFKFKTSQLRKNILDSKLTLTMTKLSFVNFKSSLSLVSVVFSAVFIVVTLLISSSSHCKGFMCRFRYLAFNTKYTITALFNETPIKLPNSLYSCAEQVWPQARNKQNNETLPSSLFRQQRGLLLLMRSAHPIRQVGNVRVFCCAF